MTNRTISALLYVGAFVSATTAAAQSHAAGTYKFCAIWQYQFNDQNLGEDYLKYTGTYGTANASYAWGYVTRGSTVVWSGYMDSAGCSAAIEALSGTYTLYITAAIKTPNNAYVVVTPQESSSSTRWFTAARSLPGRSSGGTSYYSSLGAGDTTVGVIAIATRMAQAQDGRFVPSYTYKVYTELSGYEGHWINGAVWLGHDYYSDQWGSRRKAVVAHELGHGIQERLFGIPYKPYGQDSTVELCSCVHLDHAELGQHCLQSREHIGAAQVEGFGHFHATELFNNPSESDAIFAYYKEVRTQIGGPDLYPPVGVAAYTAGATYHWMEAKGCTLSDAGTEIDWLTFFYEVNTKTSNKYSFGDIAAAFKGACGGALCTETRTTTWTSLQNSVNARFGASSAKATYWATMGDWHGVNH